MVFIPFGAKKEENSLIRHDSQLFLWRARGGGASDLARFRSSGVSFFACFSAFFGGKNILRILRTGGYVLRRLCNRACNFAINDQKNDKVDNEVKRPAYRVRQIEHIRLVNPSTSGIYPNDTENADAEKRNDHSDHVFVHAS